jgi:hypothetical protein
MKDPKKKRKAGRPRSLSEPRPSFMLKLPEVYRQQLRRLKLKNRRPISTEVMIALEEYLAKAGLWPPEPETPPPAAP